MISVVVLTHNDEDTLPRTLKSLTWCDEIIVTDDESKDKTIEIAKKLGATVYSHKLNDDFAGQRNFGLSKSSGEWVLFVDSDEVVTGALSQEIRTVISKTDTATKSRYSGDLSSDNQSAIGFYVKRRDYLFGRWLEHGETSNVRLLRLAKKDAGKWVRPVHEVWDVRGPVGELQNPFLHYPHSNVAQFLDEINRYSTLNANYLFAQGIRVAWWQIIAYPVGKFFLNYFWYLGFLDDTAGAVVAIMMSFHSFLVRSKLWQLWDKT